MALVGLFKRNHLCKICNSFKDPLLNEITLDILLKRRTWKEMCIYYTKFLPRGVSKLNEMNIRSHRHHSDPKLIAQEYMRDHGEPVTPAEAIMYVFSKQFLEEMDRKKLLIEMYKMRVRNLEHLQNIHDSKVQELNSLSNEDVETRENLIDEIKTISNQIDRAMSNIQDVIIKESNGDKGLIASKQTVNINFINNVQIKIQNLLQELVPYIMTDLFKDEQERGKAFLEKLSEVMDRHLLPVLDETKLLTQGRQ